MSDSQSLTPSPQNLDDVAWHIVSDALHPRANLSSFERAEFRRLLELRVEEEARRRGLPVAELAQAVTRAVAELTGRRETPDRHASDGN